jgi:hypothetical protein
VSSLVRAGERYFANLMLAVLMALPIQSAVNSLQAASKYLGRDVRLAASDNLRRQLESAAEQHACLRPRVAELLKTLGPEKIALSPAVTDSSVVAVREGSVAIRGIHWPELSSRLEDPSFEQYHDEELRRLAALFCLNEPNVPRAELLLALRMGYAEHDAALRRPLAELQDAVAQDLEQHAAIRKSVVFALLAFFILHPWLIYEELATARKQLWDNLDPGFMNYINRTILLALVVVLATILGVSWDASRPYEDSLLFPLVVVLGAWSLHDIFALWRAWHASRWVPAELRSIGFEVRNISTYYHPYLWWLMLDLTLVLLCLGAWRYLIEPPSSLQHLAHARYLELGMVALLVIVNLFAYFFDFGGRRRRRS